MKIGGQIPWNVIPICETSQICYLMGRRPMKDVLGNHLKDRLFHSVHWLSITLHLWRTSQESINLERKSYLDCSSDTHYTRGEFGRVTYWLQTLRSWRRWTHRKSTQKDSMRKRWYFPKKKENLFFQSHMDESNPWRRSRPENIHLDTGPPNSMRKSPWFSWRNRRVSSTTSRLVSGYWWSDKWLLVHVRKLQKPPSRWTQSQTLLAERRIIPYSLKYTDVSRTTHTNLDVMQESRIDDYWNIDGSRDLSDSWTGFTQCTLFEEKPPDGKMWSGGRLTRRQLTSRPDHLWPELWEKMGKKAKLKEKQKWSHEKPHLDNTRKLRGIYFIDPEGK